MSEDFIGVDKDGAFSVGGKYFYLIGVCVLAILVFVFILSINSAEQRGFARGYVCALDQTAIDNGAVSNPDFSGLTYCKRFHDYFNKSQLEQARVIE